MTEPTRSAESSPPGAAAFLWQAPTRTATGLEPPSGRIYIPGVEQRQHRHRRV